jgi:hypothetical protein
MNLPQLKNMASRGWVSRSLGVVAGLLLAAVPALALTLIGPAVSTTAETGSQGPAVDSTSTPPSNLLAFDAPTTTLRRAKAAEAGFPGTASRAGEPTTAEDVLVLSDWRFTQAFHRHTGTPFTVTFTPDAFFLLLQELILLEQEILILEQILLNIVSHRHHNNPSPHH